VGEESKEESKLIKKLKSVRVVRCPKCGKDGAVKFVYEDGKIEVQCTYCEPEKYM